MPDVFVNENKVPKTEDETKNPVSDIGTVETTEFKKHHFHFPFKSWIYKPHWVNFETKRNKEEVVLLLRRHLITNVPWIVIAFLMLLAPIVITSFPIISFLPANFQFVAILVWYLVTFAFILESFLVWFFNVGIITNVRLVDIDFHNLLIKEVSDAETDFIQDVTYQMNGAIRAIFNYGDVYIQTAGERPNIEYLAVPKPDQVVKVLQKLREHHHKR